MKKLLVVMFLLALVVPLTVSAQSVDNEIFGMEFGFLGGYNLAADETVVGNDFALKFTLSDSMQLGFRSISFPGATVPVGGLDYSFLNFTYFLMPQVSIDMMVGSEATNGLAGGVDAAFTLFSSDDDEAFSSGLKVKAGYIFDETGVDNGVMNAGLVGSIGY
ncbi:MAG: hypothetical protein K9M94_15485 [Spirochaetia bacterium]|nr:hypothetical protein [Spirochaetia bacterium]